MCGQPIKSYLYKCLLYLLQCILIEEGWHVHVSHRFCMGKVFWKVKDWVMHKLIVYFKLRSMVQPTPINPTISVQMQLDTVLQINYKKPPSASILFHIDCFIHVKTIWCVNGNYLSLISTNTNVVNIPLSLFANSIALLYRYHIPYSGKVWRGKV